MVAPFPPRKGGVTVQTALLTRYPGAGGRRGSAGRYEPGGASWAPNGATAAADPALGCVVPADEARGEVRCCALPGGVLLGFHADGHRRAHSEAVWQALGA